MKPLNQRRHAKVWQAYSRHACSSVHLTRGCEDILFFEFSDPVKGIRLISLLVHESVNVKVETVEGARARFVLRFNTGSGSNGRLFFRRESDKLDVLVSTKQEQESAIKYVRNHT